MKADAEVIPFRLRERDGFRLDPVEMAFAFKGVDMAFLCNPNNPTGRLTLKNEMMEVVNYALKEGVKLVVDEAFMDFVESETIVKDAVQTSHLICIRAFSKLFGMPGLRVGYAVCGEELASVLNAGSEPWPVGITASHAAIAALKDWRHIKHTLKIVNRERERLLSELRLLPGVEPFPCAANFILIKFASMDGRSITQTLGLRGILVRDCSTIPGLDNRYIRVAVRTKKENARLLTELRDVLMRG
jgi:threonine-phosphate decarboxylase